MRKTHFSILAFLPVAMLAGCSANAGSSNISMEQHLQNPLFAERYWEEMVDRMVSRQLNDPEIVKDPAKAAVIDEIRSSALEKAQEQTRKRREGTFGYFVSINEPTEGQALLIDKTLYIGPSFMTVPGPNLHIYLTQVVDPRDSKTFPDEATIDLGPLSSPYDEQVYHLPANTKDIEKYRTVVLYDTELERLYAFVQLTK